MQSFLRYPQTQKDTAKFSNREIFFDFVVPFSIFRIGESNKYLVEQFGAQSIPTWKDWVEKHLYKSKLKLNNGIPRTINDMQYINDMTTYMNYLSKDVFNSFRQKRASRTHHTAEMQYEKGCNDQAKEEYHKLFTAVAEELNPGRNIKDIKRVSTSFPYSVNHLGHIISSVRKPRIHEGKARDLKTNKEIYFSENINAQEKIQDFDTSFTEKVDAPFGYLLYTRCMNFQDFHDSYKYLLLVIARRLEFTSVELQRYVHYIESLIFEEQLYERYQDWLQCFQILNLRR